MNTATKHSPALEAGKGWDYPYSCTGQDESSDYGAPCDCAACSWTFRIVEVPA